MDSYQPIYDAVRSKISNGDIGHAVDASLRNVGGYAHQAFSQVPTFFYGYERPSAIYRPNLSRDGDMWCALYGDNLQGGCAGFGDSPDKAMQDFDKSWTKSLTTENAKGR